MTQPHDPPPDPAIEQVSADDLERSADRRLQTLAAVLLAAVVPGLFWLANHGRRETSWMIVAVVVLMVLAELFPIDLELRHESHSFSFSKAPIVIGIFLLAPFVAVLARLTSSMIVLFGVHRQRPLKLTVNLLAHTIEVMVAASVVILLRPPGPFGPAAWGVALLAVTLADLASALVISAAISVFQGRWEPGLLGGVAAGLVAGVPDLAIAIAMVTMLEANQSAVWVVFGSGIAFVAVSRAYSKVTARYRSMELLDQFTRALGAAVLDGSVTGKLISETADILHADAAWLIVRDGDGTRILTSEDGTVSELPSRGIDMAIVALAADRATLLREDCGLAAELEAAGLHEAIFCLASTDTSRDVVLAVADRSGTVRPFDSGDAELLQTLAVHAGLALLSVDLVEQLRDEVTTTEFHATHDALTGLPNRVLFQRELDRALAAGDRPAVFLIDLDRFKDVNDTLGHHNGDRLLAEIGQRLQHSIGTGHTVARLGGDEFAAMLTGTPTHDAARAIAFDLAAAIERPVTIADVEVDVGASIGVAFATDDANTADALLRQADVAMYTAKADRSVVEQYSPGRDNYSPQRLSLVGRLRTAIETGELELHYQPQIELATGAVIGVEALARWPQPGRDPIPPDEFIHIAEHTGLIRPLTRLVIELAVAQAARWHQQGRNLRVSLNLSPHNLIEPGIVDSIAHALSAAGLPAERLMIELTETTVMANPERTLGVIQQLRDLGVGLAIDDFGTGHSSLAYLTALPVTELKIDKSFVLAMGSETAATSIVRSIVDLGRNLNLDVIAEGVETEPAARALTAMGCRLAQGYLYSRPLDTRAFERWHANHDANMSRAAHPGRLDSAAHPAQSTTT